MNFIKHTKLPTKTLDICRWHLPVGVFQVSLEPTTGNYWVLGSDWIYEVTNTLGASLSAIRKSFSQLAFNSINLDNYTTTLVFHLYPRSNFNVSVILELKEKTNSRSYFRTYSSLVKNKFTAEDVISKGSKYGYPNSDRQGKSFSTLPLAIEWLDNNRDRLLACEAQINKFYNDFTEFINE